jgi:antitoxin component of MazEF toxin-antitoxin module
MYPEVPLGLCPACFTGRNAAMQRESVALEVESDRKTIITVKTAEEVSEALVQYRDQESSEIVTRPQTDAELEKRLDNLELITNQAAQLQDSEL